MFIFQCGGEKGNEKRSRKKEKKNNDNDNNNHRTQTTTRRFTDTHFTIVPFGNVITN